MCVLIDGALGKVWVGNSIDLSTCAQRRGQRSERRHTSVVMVSVVVVEVVGMGTRVWEGCGGQV